jgi:hypothetical protein
MDADDDGFGDPLDCQDAPDPPGPDWVPNDDDCDDADPLVVMGCAPCDPGSMCVMDELHTCNQTGTFTFVEPCEFGCDPIALQCNFAPLTVQAGPDVDIMAGGNTQLACTAMGGDGNYSYQWDNAGSLDDAMIAAPVATPTQTTTYTCTVTDGQPVMAADSTTVHVVDAQIDFGACSIVDFGIDEGPDNAQWQFQMGGTRACETANGEPSAVVCDFVLDNAAVTGLFAVETGQDDDSIGIVFGWQDVGHFYVFSWKQAGQNFMGCGTLPAGMTIKMIDSDMGLGCPDLMGDADTAVSTVLATPATFYDQGWVDDEVYVIELQHTPMDFTITVYLASDMSVVATTTVMDSTYPSGQFGLFAFSQIDACFEDFTTQGL